MQFKLSTQAELNWAAAAANDKVKQLITGKEGINQIWPLQSLQTTNKKIADKSQTQQNLSHTDVTNLDIWKKVLPK